MWDMNPRKVLVGVDSVDCEAALVFAAAEAHRRGCGVHLVHVARPALLGARAVVDVVLVEDQLIKVGEAILAETASRMERLLSDDERTSVSTELSHGSTVGVLVSLSAHACLVVLQHEGMGPSGETSTLSVTGGVAAHAHCPVVAVPTDWRQDAKAPSAVVVGVEDPRGSTEVVRVALEEADRRKKDLLLVHALPPSRGLTETEERAESARRQADLTTAYARLLATHPTVAVEAFVGCGRPGAALLEQAGAGVLLVVGRHHRKHIVGASIGPVVREVLRWSSVPVMVVDPLTGDGSTRTTESDLATEAIP